MSWIIESRKPGEKVRYISATQVRNEYWITEYRICAHQFESPAMARVVARRFSSLHNLVITEVK